MPSCILIKFLRQLLYSKYPPFDSISTVLSKIGLKEGIEKHFFANLGQTGIWDKPVFTWYHAVWYCIQIQRTPFEI